MLSKKEKKLKNIIDLNSILSGEEKRTVVRLNPIPPNYSSFDVCKLLDKYLQIESGKNQRIYKALYTSLCKIIGKNLGYCFVMMVKPEYVIDFIKLFMEKVSERKNVKNHVMLFGLINKEKNSSKPLKMILFENL